MLNYVMNSKEFEFQADSQLSSILAEFDSPYIISIIHDVLSNVFNSFDVIPKPNIIQSFETVFKQLFQYYPTDSDNIINTRTEIYRDIINYICSIYNMTFVQNENTDFYTVAFNLYDFFVAKFDPYLVEFYSKFIVKEKENIYNSLSQDALKKSKDSDSVYNKLMFDNKTTLITVINNIPEVINNIINTNVSDSQVYEMIYLNATTQDNLSMSVAIINLMLDHFKTSNGIVGIYRKLLSNPVIYPNILTALRMKIQQDNLNIINPRLAAQFTK